MDNIFKHLSNMVWKNILWEKMKRENDELKDKEKKAKIYDDQILENIKKYYNIEDHEDLLKFIKLNRLVINLDNYYDEDNDIIINESI